jgi:signal transduction histidine kinase
MSVAATLATVPLFANLDNRLLESVVAIGRTAALAPEQVVFREGDPPDGLYVILSGEVSVYRQQDDDTQLHVRTLGPGQYFGELALLDGGPRSASVATRAPSELFLLERAAFLQLLPRAPGLLAAVMANMTYMVRDNTERLVRESLEQRAVRAEMELARFRALAEMVAGVAHEVNTPLGIVNTAASIIKNRVQSEALRRAAEDPRARDALDDVHEAVGLLEANVARAHRLIQNFKKLSVGQVADEKETLDLVEVVEEVVQLFSISARQAKLAVQVTSDLPDRAARQWVGYRGLLTQVLLNLLTNVERYAYPDGGGGRVEIVVGADEHRREVPFVITVRDFGRGIPPEDQPRVFEPFFTTGRGRGGTGLGLSIVHTIVTSALKGSIELASEPGRGTEICVRFPRTIAD